MTVFSPPRHIVWSTDRLYLADPFQRKWYIRQVIEHGRAVSWPIVWVTATEDVPVLNAQIAEILANEYSSE